VSRLLLISLGQLTGAVLESMARSGRFEEIVVASRSPERARMKANNARVGAAIEGRFPRIEAAGFDLNDEDAGSRLAQIRPDVIFAAPSLMPWWAIDRLSEPKRALARAVPFGGFIAFHLAPMLRLRDAWVASRLRAPLINGSYPDVVNAVLHATGPAPTSGVGNVVEAVPKIRFAAAEALGVGAEHVSVKLVAQHAFEYFLYSAERHERLPPYLVKVVVDGRDVSESVRARIAEPFPIPYDLDFNLFTASACAILLPALLSDHEVATHVPGPEGLIGGYPVLASRNGVRLDLPREWSRERAVATNRASLPWDGIAELEGDGGVRFAGETASALRRLLGRTVERLKAADAPSFAAELRAALVAA